MTGPRIFVALTLLWVVLVILKSLGLIDWSWWWVSIPLWLGGGGLLITVAVGYMVMWISRGRPKP